jgi:hypothetical protein
VADSPRHACSSRVLRVLARLYLRSVVPLSFHWARFRTVRSSGADSPRVPGGQSACSPRMVRYSGSSLEVLFAFSDGPRRRAERSVVYVRTVHGSRPDGPCGPCGRSVWPVRTVRSSWPDGPPEPECFDSWFDSSLLLSCFRVCFKESFLRLEVDP